MRRFPATLITLLCAAILLVNSAYARKINKARRDSLTTLSINTDSVSGDAIILFAETLMGTRYRPATSDPFRGFDCSGFVSFVFKNFNVKVPRSSPEFMDVGEKVSLEDAKPGDIMIFTSPTHHHRVGHVAIVYSNNSNGLKFIHSTSGKEYGVTVTAMDDTYRRRFVQVVRVLKMNDQSENIGANLALAIPRAASTSFYQNK
jgi:lipoprotein Spr